MGLYYLNDTGIVFSYHTIPYTRMEGTPYTSYTYCYRYTWLTISSNLVPSLHLFPLGDRGPTCLSLFIPPRGRQGGFCYLVSYSLLIFILILILLGRYLLILPLP